MNRSEVIYSCETLAKPVLHDTILQLTIDREICQNSQSRQQSFSNLLIDDNEDSTKDSNSTDDAFGNENLQVRCYYFRN